MNGNGTQRRITIRQARRLDRRLSAVETANMQKMRDGARVRIWDDIPDADAIAKIRLKAKTTIDATIALVAMRFSLRDRIDAATRKGLGAEEGTVAIARERRVGEVLDAALTERNNALASVEAIERRMEAGREGHKAGESYLPRSGENSIQIECLDETERYELEGMRRDAEDRMDAVQATLNAVGVRETVALDEHEVAMIEALGLKV